MKQVVRLTESDIHRMIEKIINEILPITTVNTITKPVIIKEGVMYSYPKQQVLKHIRDTFSLAPNLRQFNRNWRNYNGIALSKTASNNCKVILVYVPKESRVYNAVIQSMTTICGWILANETDISTTLRGYVLLQFETKSENDVTDEVLKRQFIYHECYDSRIEKIRQMGLVPKDSTWDTFQHQGRIYFWLDFPKHKLKQSMQGNKNVYGNTTSILKVNVNALDGKVKFYYDPRVPNAVYTMQNIPPQALS